MVKYYYDKYTVAQSTYYAQSGWYGREIINGIGVLDNGYKSYSFNSSTGLFSVSGGKWGTNPPVGSYSYFIDSSGKELIRYAFTQPSYTYYSQETCTGVQRTQDVRGTLQQSDIIEEDGTYPSNGKHSDGYWYVRKTVANNKPTLSITSPSNNQTLYENNTINIAGTANDTDKDQSVTTYYQINSEPKKVLATNLSQTQIALSKQLTFKSGKLFDGDTAISGVLADGVAHTLKIWAEDSEKASSEIIERAFYVVPNRAPLLTVDSVIPSGVVDTDKFKITGTSSDLDANASVTVTRRINAGNAVEIYNGPGGAWEFEISLAQLMIGVNTIVIEVIDNYGAKTSKTIKINKNEVKTPILHSVARYKIEPPKGTAKGVLLWIQRDDGLELSAELSMTLKGEQEAYVPLVATNTAPVSQGIVEDEFYHETAEPKENIILKISMSRSSTTVNNKINLISGVLE